MLRTIPRVRLLIIASIAVVLGACAAGTKSATSGTASTPRKDPNVLDSTDLRGRGFQTLYDAIAGQRGDWLIPRGGVGSGGQGAQLGVFMGMSTRTMGVEYLKALRPTDVISVKRLSPTDALHNYGWQWSALVITVR